MSDKTDKKLLELAAKAVGLEIIDWIQDGNGVHVAILCDGTRWQPLHENQLTDCMGDALRLSVKLRMVIRVEEYGAAARIEGKQHVALNGCEEHLHGGIEAATRRAIVRAAAAIGETML